MRILNVGNVTMTPLRKHAFEIIEAGLEAIATEAVVQKQVFLKNSALCVRDASFELKSGGKLIVIGIGKCALEAGRALEGVLGDRISDGMVVDVHEGTLKKLHVFRGTHPFPSEQNVDATHEIIRLLSGLSEDDFVLFVISGGGSTLLCQPKDFTCQEEATLVQCLFKAGVTIQEMNVVRKHLSLARGGYLAQYAYPARVVSLIFSDVPGNQVEVIASGPTVYDETTVADAVAILKKYHAEESCGVSPQALIETPKDKKYFEKVTNILFVTNTLALEEMRMKAESLGFAARIVTDTLTGEARDEGIKIVRTLHNVSSQQALLYGGETTVTIKHPGKGGRNQELGLSALQEIKDAELVLSFASDGRDNTDIAGGIADTTTKVHEKKLELESKQFLEENRSYDFFKATGDYIETGDTGSNVSDLIVALKL